MAGHDLVSVHEELYAVVRGDEDWQESYKRSPETFEQLVALEALLFTASADYLAALSERALAYVDWDRLPKPVLQADHGPVVNNDDPAWQEEQKLLSIALLRIITELVAIGAVAGEDIYKVPAGLDSLDDSIMRAARLHVAELVSQVTDTTRRIIREAVATSIQLGEDIDAAKARLMKTVNNPVRAELIAATESVNSYQSGLYTYAKSSGAVSREWDGLAGACSLCSQLIGQTVGIDEPFKLKDGTEVMKPAIHPRDRCGLIYNYE